jgi:uncharacterized OB-fold protein
MSRPRPHPTEISRPYWEACARHELLLQWCVACGKPQFYPRSVCVRCGGSELEWRRASGRATVYTFSVVHRAPDASLPTPYIVALVDLEEGVRMMTNVVECDPADARIGMAVEVTFDDLGDGMSVPLFRPAR